MGTESMSIPGTTKLHVPVCDYIKHRVRMDTLLVVFPLLQQS